MSKRKGTNLFIATTILLLAIDALPSTFGLHRQLKNTLSPLYNSLGIYQGSWNLFAPDVDKTNHRVSAKILLSDGKILDWQSPEWSEQSVLKRFVHFRHMEYQDSLLHVESEKAWNAYAKYIASLNEAPNITKIELYLESAHIPTPSEHPLSRPYLRFDKPQRIHIWEKGQ